MSHDEPLGLSYQEQELHRASKEPPLCTHGADIEDCPLCNPTGASLCAACDTLLVCPDCEGVHPPSTMLGYLAGEIREVNAANGWETPRDFSDPHEIPVKLALIHSEVSEALEAFRNGDHANFAEELADTLIRLLDLAAGLGIDMDRQVAEKVEKNRHRGFRHGGKRV